MKANLQYNQPYHTQDNRTVNKAFWARHAKEKPLKDFRAVNTPDRSPLPQFISREPQVVYGEPSYDSYYNEPRHTPRTRVEVGQYLYNFREKWLYEEISFSMNKLSLTGLVFGLMVLGVVFFAIGFLSAMFTMAPGGAQPQAGQQQASIWDRVNNDFKKFEQSRTGQIVENQAGYAVADQLAQRGGYAGEGLSQAVESGVDRTTQQAPQSQQSQTVDPHYPAYGYPTQSSGAQPQPAHPQQYRGAPVTQHAPQQSAQQNPYDPRAQQMPQHPQQQQAAGQGYGPQTAGYAQNPAYSHPSAESTQWANQSAMRY